MYSLVIFPLFYPVWRLLYAATIVNILTMKIMRLASFKLKLIYWILGGLAIHPWQTAFPLSVEGHCVCRIHTALIVQKYTQPTSHLSFCYFFLWVQASQNTNSSRTQVFKSTSRVHTIIVTGLDRDTTDVLLLSLGYSTEWVICDHPSVTDYTHVDKHADVSLPQCIWFMAANTTVSNAYFPIISVWIPVWR